MAKTRAQIAQELGISKTTLWRLLKGAPFTIGRGLIFPAQEELIRNFVLYRDIRVSVLETNSTNMKNSEPE